MEECFQGLELEKAEREALGLSSVLTQYPTERAVVDEHLPSTDVLVDELVGGIEIPPLTSHKLLREALAHRIPPELLEVDGGVAGKEVEKSARVPLTGYQREADCGKVERT